MAAKRVTRKQLLKEPDEFISLTGRVVAWVKAHPKQLAIGAGVFVGLLVMVTGYRYIDERRAQAASRLLSQGISTFQQRLESGDKSEALEAVRSDFDKLINDFSGQPAGHLGLVYYGQILLGAGKYEEAVKMLQRAWTDLGNDPALANIILESLAEAFLQAGDKTAAITQFEKLVSGGGTLYKDAAMFQLGVLYFESDQAEKGKAMLTRLTETFPASRYAEMAREKIAG